MKDLTSSLSVQKDNEGNMPKLHFDTGTQTTSVTKMHITGWIISQKNQSKLKVAFDYMALHHNSNETFEAIESASHKIYQRALEYSYNPLSDPKTQNICLEIMLEELYKIMARTNPEMKQIRNKEVAKNPSGILSDILRLTAVMNVYVRMLTGEIPQDADRLKAITETANEDFPIEIQKIMREIYDELSYKIY